MPLQRRPRPVTRPSLSQTEREGHGGGGGSSWGDGERSRIRGGGRVIRYVICYFVNANGLVAMMLKAPPIKIIFATTPRSVVLGGHSLNVSCK